MQKTQPKENCFKGHCFSMSQTDCLRCVGNAPKCWQEHQACSDHTPAISTGSARLL